MSFHHRVKKRLDMLAHVGVISSWREGDPYRKPSGREVPTFIVVIEEKEECFSLAQANAFTYGAWAQYRHDHPETRESAPETTPTGKSLLDFQPVTQPASQG